MKFFNSMLKKAEIIEEARSARHAAIFDLGFITDQLKSKKLGVPYRDARRFWYQWARDEQIWPEGIPTDSKTPVDAKSINAIIGAYVTSSEFKPEVEQKWKDYANDTKNIEQFFGLTRSTRAGKRGIELAKSESDIKALTPEEIAQRKEQAKKDKVVDTEKVDFAELKVKVMAKFDNPKLRQHLIDFALDNEVDSDTEAEQIADTAIDAVSSAFKDAHNISDVLDKLDELQSSEDSATADLAEAAFSFIKKKITIEDEDQGGEPEEESDSSNDLTPEEHDTLVKQRSEEVYEPEDTSDYLEGFNKLKGGSGKLIVESSRQKFKPKTIHQLIQRQYDLR